MHNMSEKFIRFGLRQLLGGFTLATILLSAGLHVARSCRDGQIEALRGAYRDGRMDKATARGHVGDVVDSWPEMAPVRPTREPWQRRK
jgi:hypothetical protein